MFSGYSRRRRDGGSEPGGQGEGRAAGVRHGTGLAALLTTRRRRSPAWMSPRLRSATSGRERLP